MLQPTFILTAITQESGAVIGALLARLQTASPSGDAAGKRTNVYRVRTVWQALSVRPAPVPLHEEDR